MMQQDRAEACGVEDKAPEEQEGSSTEADQEGCCPIAQFRAGSDSKNSGTM